MPQLYVPEGAEVLEVEATMAKSTKRKAPAPPPAPELVMPPARRSPVRTWEGFDATERVATSDESVAAWNAAAQAEKAPRSRWIREVLNNAAATTMPSVLDPPTRQSYAAVVPFRCFTGESTAWRTAAGTEGFAGWARRHLDAAASTR